MTREKRFSRSFVLGLILCAPMLVAAEGGGCAPDDDVPIGSNKDAGATVQCGPNTCGEGETCCNESCGTCVKPGQACDMMLCTDGGGGGQPCGPNTCGAGETCCNESCGTCVKPGEACDQLLCAPDPCEAQQAKGEGPCFLALGYAWNGSACELIGGCSCVGPDCGELYQTEEACSAAHTSCGGSGQACGPVTCGQGTTCCNESCGTCVKPGEACDQKLCTPECAAQDAQGEGPCFLFLGTKWNGAQCETVGGCSCVGTDCSELYSTEEQCEAAYASCQ